MGKNEIEESNFPIKVSNVLDRTTTRLVEGLTGIAASNREKLALSVGRILQGLTAGRFLEILIKEWEKFKKEGRIKDDYESTEQCRTCLQELLDFLDKDLPDEQRFSILKQIFLVAATEDASNRDSHLPLQYMQISRTLTAGEVLVLNATYKVARHKPDKMADSREATDWLKIIARESGLTYLELVEAHENELIKKRLLSDRASRGRRVHRGSHFRLTDLGYVICEYISHYTP